MSFHLRWLGILLILLAPLALSAQDRFFDSKGVQIRYVDEGSGEPIVLIHGYTNNIEQSWIATGVLANLSRDHRVIAFDSRGHGKSGKPRDPKAYGEEMGQDVVRLMDHLKIARAHIVGYSLGGIINVKLLTTNPERYLTAIIGGALGRRNWSAADEKAAEDEAVELTQGVAFRSLILRVAPTDQPKPSEEAIRKRSQELLAVNDPIALAAMVRNRRGQAVTDAQLAAVRVPTLAIVGSADPNLAGVNELKQIIPALKVVVIQGATHSSSTARGAQRRPEFVNAIREFIAAHRQVSSR